MASYVAVASLALACYWNAVDGRHSLVFDDVSAIVDNADVRRPPWKLSSWASYATHVRAAVHRRSPARARVARRAALSRCGGARARRLQNFWGDSMTSSSARHYSYRPLVTATFAANYAWHGLSTWGYKAVNVALHALCSVQVARLARRLLRVAAAPSDAQARLAAAGRDTETTPGAVTAGLLFACHPVHVEAVTGVVGRAEVMGGACFASALLAYARALAPDVARDDCTQPFDRMRSAMVRHRSRARAVQRPFRYRDR